MNNEKNILDSLEYWTGDTISSLKPNEVFVFGSNPQARHFAGAAKAALAFGAIPIDRKNNRPGIGRGFSLNNKTYALVTKSLEAGYTEPSTGITYEKEGFGSVSKEQIRANIDELYQAARKPANLDKRFLIVYKYDAWPNGTPKKSLNGYDSQEMLEMFAKDKDIPPNIVFHESYKQHLEKLFNNNTSKHTNNERPESVKSNKSKFIEPQTPILNSVDDYDYFWGLECYQSNFHSSKFVFRNKTFVSSEQFFMYCKAMFFNRPQIADEILEFNNKNSLVKSFLNGEISRQEIIDNPSLRKQWNSIQMAFKACGRKIDNYNEEAWNEKRYTFMKEGVLQKFTQNKDLQDLMLSTGNKFFVEASPYDEIWGIKLNERDARSLGPLKWRGKNLLGCLLTEVKNQLKNNLNYQSNETVRADTSVKNKEIKVANFYTLNKVIPEDGVYIGRASSKHGLPQSIFANPYPVLTPEERDTSIEKYRKWLWNQILDGNITKDDLRELNNKTLVCYCAPKPCHGNVVKSVVEYLMNSEQEFDIKVQEGRERKKQRYLEQSQEQQNNGTAFSPKRNRP